MQVSSEEILYKQIIRQSKLRMKYHIDMPTSWSVRMIADNYNREHHDAVIWMQKHRGLELNASNCHATIKAWYLAKTIALTNSKPKVELETEQGSFQFSWLVDYFRAKPTIDSSQKGIASMDKGHSNGIRTKSQL